MRVEYINPFLESIQETFSTMLGFAPLRGEVGVSKSGAMAHEITAVIGLTGPVRGTVALSFPTQTARALVERLTGQAEAAVEETVSDGLAELVNMVAGGAKAKLNGNGSAVIGLSLPTVVRGERCDIEPLKQTVWLDVPYATDVGPFTLRVAFEFNSQGGKAA